MGAFEIPDATQATITESLRVAEATLAARTGGPVALSDPEDLGGSGRTTVVRAKVASTPFPIARTVVIKWLSTLGEASKAEKMSFLRELTSYQFATALPVQVRPGPQLLAADKKVGLLVLSDLGHGRAMTELLAEEHLQPLQQAVAAWAQALGAMHAATAGREDDFQAIRRFSGAARDGYNDDAITVADAAPEQLGRLLGDPIPGEVSDFFALAKQGFDGGALRAFSPSDVGAENTLVTDEGVKFLDYEYGLFRDASLDVGYVLTSLSDRVDDPERAREMERSFVEAWRFQASDAWSTLRRDIPPEHDPTMRAIIAARLVWVWLSTVWLAPTSFAPSLPIMPNGDAVTPAALALYTRSLRVIARRWDRLADAAAPVSPPVAAVARQVRATLSGIAWGM